MATISSGAGVFNNTTRRHYVSCDPFHNDFFTYSTTTSFLNGNWTTVGTLAPVAGATATNCPQGRVLRENGKKMYPDANPGVTTYMVGVYDDTTFLNGFINPNSPIFTPMNTDKPTYLPNGADLAIGTYAGLQNVGTGSYTQGNIFGGDLGGARIGIGNGYYTYGDVSGTTYGVMYQDGPVDETGTHIGIEAGTGGDKTGFPDAGVEGEAVYAGLYSDGTIYAISNEDRQGEFGIVNVFTNPDLSGTYAQIYAYDGDSRLAIETGDQDGGTSLAGLYSDGVIQATSTIKADGGLTVGGGTYTSNVYHGIVNFTPNVIASTGTASTIINLVGLGPSSLLFFGNTRLVDPFTIYNGFTTAASTVTIRYTHIVDGNSLTSAVAWPYMIINPV